MVKLDKKLFRKKIVKPKLKDYLTKYKSYKSEDTCQCPKCYGIGSIVHPDEESDPIEGHKLSRRITCSTCNGTGNVPLDYFKGSLEREINKWKKNEPARKEMIEILQNAYEKITEKDIEVISSILFVDMEYPLIKDLIKTLRKINDIEFSFIKSFLSSKRMYNRLSVHQFSWPFDRQIEEYLEKGKLS